MYFDTIVFAGGGTRCFWQAGFWTALEPALERPPQRLLGVSAGAIVACGSQGGVVDRFLAHSRATFDANPRNFHLAELVRGRNPFPHPSFVREAVDAIFDAEALARLRRGIPVHVLAARLPARVPTALASSAVQLAYVLERRVGRRLHGDWGTRIGFRPHWEAAGDCRSTTALRDLILASSAIPPAFGVQRLGGLRMMDGGFVGNALIEFEGVDPGRRLVLVTRKDWPVPAPRPDLVYARPSRAVPVSKLDATSGARVEAAFELGVEDGVRFRASPNFV